MRYGAIASSVAVIVCLSTLAPASAQTLTGEWNWGAGGGHTVVTADGRGRDGRGNTMTWTLVDPAARRYRLIWSHGFTDDALLSADGSQLQVVNNVGTRFTATRRVTADSAAGAAGGTGGAGGAVAGGGGSISPWTTLRPSSSVAALRVLSGTGFAPGNYVVFVGRTDESGRLVTGHVSYGPYEVRADETWRATMGTTLRFERTGTSSAGRDRASIQAENTDIGRWQAICVLPAGMAVSSCGGGHENVGVAPEPADVAGASPPAPGGMPPGGTRGLPPGEDSFDSTSYRRGDPFDGGEWANSQNGYAFARRVVMPPVCIAGLTLASAGSDVNTRGASITIDLVGPYGATMKALDLHGVAIARDFSGDGSGELVPPQSTTFPPFQTMRVEVSMKGNGWFLMKGLTFNVVPCP